jgi:tRNA 2-selenouridine synthase
LIKQLEIQEFLTQAQGHLTLDVRSEAEYAYGHIPGAVNLPLFNNDERKIVGTLYKQKGQQEAILQGLDITGPKMAGFVRFVQQSISENKVFVHCWRGGMRSGSMAWLFNLFGYEVYTLKGGYKSYRHRTLEIIGHKYKFIIIGGRTGTGKTAALHQLKEAGEQIIDLEQLANHKGSAFGALGQPPQPSTEHFENLLATELQKLSPDKRIWLEDESKTIGRVFLDLNLWKNMCIAPIFVIDIPFQLRLKRLVSDYGENHIAGLEQAILNIQKRLGNEQCKNAIDALRERNFERAAEITLNYYDKAYDKSLALKEGKETIRFSFEEDNMEHIAAELMNAANRNYGN